MKANNFPKKGEVILAPLAGYTHSAFRRICRKLGADRTYSELVHAYGLTLRGFEKNKELIFVDLVRIKNFVKSANYEGICW